jgi:predicted aspartyl protease
MRLRIWATAAVPLESFGNRLFVAAHVNGAPVAALLDSGAEMSVLDNDFAARLGLTQTGEATAHGSGAATMRARFAEGVALRAVGRDLPDRTVAILDLGEMSARLVGRPVWMILGRDLFDSARLRIDIEGGTIDPVERDSEPTGVRLELTPYRGIETFPAAVEGHGPVQAVFDLGNGSEVMVGRAFAERAGLAAPERIVDRRSGGGLGGAIERGIVVLATLEIAGRIFRDVPASIDESPSAADLNVGTSILRHFVVTTDFAEKAIWLASRVAP